MNKKFKAIFFDNDGILVDTEKLYFEATKRVFLKMEIELTVEMYIEYFLNNSHGTWHIAKGKGFTEEEISAFRKERNELYSELLKNETQIISGVEKVLKQLNSKYLMGIVTSSRKDHFDIIHSSTGLLKYFDFTLTSDDYKNTKPSPEPYLTALKNSGFEKKDCIVVEDSQRGLISAKTAGLKCCIIPTELTKYSDFSKADYVLKDISELPDIL